MSDLKQFKERTIEEFVKKEFTQWHTSQSKFKRLSDSVKQSIAKWWTPKLDQSYEQGKADMEKKTRQVIAEYTGIDEIRAEELINLLTTN